MNFDDLSPELQSRARECKTPEEILALAKEQGYELTEDELEAVSGGAWNNCSSYVRYTKPCPRRSKYVK